MAEIVLRKNWEAAKQWARTQARSLGFIAEPHQDNIWLIGERQPGELVFEFWAEDQRTLGLEQIAFKLGNKQIRWYLDQGIEVPHNLWELLRRGKIAYQYQHEDAREILWQHAQDVPGFAQIYAEIYDRLFPKLEHHELTAAPEEDYLECLNRDAAIIRRLKHG